MPTTYTIVYDAGQAPLKYAGIELLPLAFGAAMTLYCLWVLVVGPTWSRRLSAAWTVVFLGLIPGYIGIAGLFDRRAWEFERREYAARLSRGDFATVEGVAYLRSNPAGPINKPNRYAVVAVVDGMEFRYTDWKTADGPDFFGVPAGTQPRLRICYAGATPDLKVLRVEAVNEPRS